MTSSRDGAAVAAGMFERHGSAVRRYLRRLTGQSDLADDLAQDVYLRVVRTADAYEHREREQAWLFRIARNVYLDHRKQQARRLPGGAVPGDVALAPGQAVRTDLAAALERLDDVDRETFLLCEVAGLRYEEIAAVLNLTGAAVRSRIYRARMALREMLMPPAPLPPVTGRRSRSDDD